MAYHFPLPEKILIYALAGGSFKIVSPDSLFNMSSPRNANQADAAASATGSLGFQSAMTCKINFSLPFAAVAHLAIGILGHPSFQHIGELILRLLSTQKSDFLGSFGEPSYCSEFHKCFLS